MSEIEQIFRRTHAALAPMAGITNSIFRSLMVGLGARPVVTEMISADKIAYQENWKTDRLLKFSEEERPVGIQLFGSSSDIFARAAYRCAALDPDFIDLNFGCPVRKVVKRGGGAALMRDPELCGKIAREVVRSVDCPVTIKIRSGWSDDEINAVEVACSVVSEGAAGVIVHPRTRTQIFGGKADWTIIAKVVEAVNVPVIGNGDIRSSGDSSRMLGETGCHSVMVGRGVLTNPWLIREIRNELSGQSPGDIPHPAARLLLGLLQLRLSAREVDEKRAVFWMRKFFGFYSKGLWDSNSFRRNIFRAESIEEVTSLISSYLEYLEFSTPGILLSDERIREYALKKA